MTATNSPAGRPPGNLTRIGSLAARGGERALAIVWGRLPSRPITLCGTVTYVGMDMPDTKRGRERKGRMKREQRRRYEIEQALEARDHDLDFEELYEGAELELEVK